MATGNDRSKQAEPLLFVVRDQTTVRTQSAQERFEVYSYVQRTRRERTNKTTGDIQIEKRSVEEAASKANETSSQKHRWRLNTIASDKDSKRDGRGTTKHGRTQYKGFQEHNAVRQLLTIAPSPPEIAVDLSQENDPASEKRPWVVHPQTILAKGNSDPFHSTAVPMSPRLNATVQAARGLAAFFIWPAEAVLREKSTVMRAWWKEVDACLKEPDWLYSYCAYACVVKAVAHESDRQNLIADGLAFKGESLQRLRVRMATRGPDKLLLLMVVHHFGVEFYSRNLFAANTHLKAAQQIVDTVGGLDALLQHQKEILLTSDIVMASIALSRPRWDVEEWDPGFVEAAVKRVRRPDRAIVRLKAAIDHSKQNDPSPSPAIQDQLLLTTFLALRELFHVEDYKRRILTSSGIIVDEIFRWLHLRKLACWSRLLGYYIDIAKPVSLFNEQHPGQRIAATTDEHCFQSLLCVAAIYAETAVFNFPGLPSAHARYSALLQTVFLTCLRKLGKDTLLSPEYGPGFLWAMAIGSVDEVSHISKEGRTWHTAVFSYLAWSLKLRTMEDVKACLKTFAYSELALDTPLRAVVDNLEGWTLEGEVTVQNL